MKTFIYILICFTLCACGDKGGATHEHPQEMTQKLYTCPMHPQIVKNEPGQCPICGMALVEKTSGRDAAHDSSFSHLLRPANEFVAANVPVITVTETEETAAQKAEGVITYDTRNLAAVSSRVNGRIEKLFVKFEYQPVQKGQKLMEIYSEELVAEQNNYLLLLKNDASDLSLLRAAEEKLMLLGLTAEELSLLRKSGATRQRIPVYSPYSGHLHNTSLDNASTGMSMQQEKNSALPVSEGSYVERGKPVFYIYGTHKVWALLTLYGANAGLKEGTFVRLKAEGRPDSLEGRIDFIEPVLKSDQRGAAARVYLDNSDNSLKIGAAVSASIGAASIKGLFVPSSAVLSLGASQVAFRAEGNMFKAVRVTTGKRVGEKVEIRSGISRGDRIAANAQMLVDSESFVKVNQ
jgi:membrane fusion protein, copper/silver efflux system